MKIAVHLARHRRLAAWVGLSLLLHLLALILMDARMAPAPMAVGAPLALRLVRERPMAPPTPAPAEPVREPVPAPPMTEAAATAPAIAADTPAPQPASNAAPGIAPLQMPGRYRVRLPPSARLTYTVTRSAPGQAAAPQDGAQLVWEKSGGAWRLQVDGVLGSLASEGGEDDAGVAPDKASEALAAGVQDTRFNREEERIDYGASAASAPLHPGSQDRASALLQLAGMGLADPDQVQEVVDLVVAGSNGARIERWQVVGNEQLTTPAGVLATVRLARLTQAGEARIELWLAPGHNWLPVQLRVTQPDGAVANQLVSAIESEAWPTLQ